MSNRTRTRPGTRRPTMSDVAQLAGVSQTTVSFVINGTDLAASIPPETQDRVREAIRTLGYRPNAAAKLLRTHASHSIGFITDETAVMPHAGGMIAGAHQVAWEAGKVLIIVNTGGDPVVADAAVEIMLERRVEGIIYVADHHMLVDPPAALKEVPSVLLDCFCADQSLPSVVPDEVQGGRSATDLLVSKGHRRIGMINVNPRDVANLRRLAGYQQALEAVGVVFDPALVRDAMMTNANDGYQYAIELLSLPNPPTAIFCATDRMAMGAYDALKERGYRIPGDVAIVGFDDQELISRFLRPPLSTVALPHRAMGEWAASYLVNYREASPDVPPVQCLMPCPLVERESAEIPRSVHGVGSGSRE